MSFTLLARGWSILAAPFSLYFVARFLSAAEQGFYYTFSSILAMQVVLELGVAYGLMQFISHERASLEWTSDGILVGNVHAKGRIASLFQVAIRWYAVIAVLGVLTLAVVGWVFFSHRETGEVHWRIPWLLMVLITGVNLTLTPFRAVLEGSGKVAELARVNVRDAVFGSIFFWAALIGQCKLYAAPALACSSAILGGVYVVGRHWSLFRDLWRTPVAPGAGVKWRDEILPFQWKISLSWLSGYFIFQMINPVMFRFHGPIEAGRMGMTMRIVDSITMLAYSWTSTKAAPFGHYIARRDYHSLDRAFRLAAWQSIGVSLLCSLAFMAVFFALRAAGSQHLHRLLDPLSIVLLLGNGIIGCVVFNQAVYLRAHKREPFLLNSLLGAVIVPAILYFLGRPYGAFGFAIGVFCTSALIGLPLATYIFFRKKREWHMESNA